MAIPSPLPLHQESFDHLLTPVLAAGLELVAARRLGDAEEARDAAQETLSRALQSLRDGRAPAPPEFDPYVYGILRNVIIDRQRRRATATLVIDPPATSPSALDCLVADEERRAIAGAVHRLPAADRDLLRRCFVEGQSIARIAEQTGEPAERLRQRKGRALRRLRDLLGTGHEMPRRPMVAT